MLLRFIDRKNELRYIEERYASKKAEFFVVYGRRRIGKTELIKQFARAKNHFYFLAKEEDIRLEIERFREKFSEKFNIRIEKTIELEKIFNEILKKVDLTRKLVIVIDEFPFWISKHHSIVSEFQYLWDEVLSKHNVFLILMGSSVSMIENEILSHKSPLFGRRTGQIRVESIPIPYLREFLPNYNTEELFGVYGIVGAVPFYLKEFDSKNDIFSAIKGTFLNKSNILYEEAESLLREELREVNTYFNVIRAIQEGSTKLAEISSKSRVDITNINKYLATLIRLNLIKKEYCVTLKPKSKNFVYAIDDNYFNFWLKYVYPYEEEIEENPNSVLDIIKSEFSAYMGPVFEDICKRFVRHSDFFGHTKLGRWWHKENEIDIVALNETTKEILFAECKWQDKVDAEQILTSLKENSKFVEWHNDKRKEHFAVFAKSFKKKLKEKNIHLFDLSEIGRTLNLVG